MRAIFLQTSDLVPAILDEANDAFLCFNFWDGEPEKIEDLIMIEMYGLDVYFNLTFTRGTYQDYNPSTNRTQDFSYYTISDLSFVEAERGGLSKFVEFSLSDVLAGISEYHFER